MTEYERTPRTTLRRLPKRGNYDRATVHAILDEAVYCHVGFAVEGQPYVIPTAFGRDGETVYLHGSAASRMLKTLAGGVEACVTATLLDGLVLARSAFHHSVNYRSVVILGRARPVTEASEKSRALEVIVDHVAPGRSAEVRPPNDKELAATSVLALALDEVSAKVRTGPPIDDEEDYALTCWAGELPLRVAAAPPVPDPRLADGIAPSLAVAGWHRPGSRRVG